MKNSGLMLIFLFAASGCGDNVEVEVSNPNTQISIITQPDTLVIGREKSITINPLANDSVSQNRPLKLKSVSEHPALKLEVTDNSELKVTPLNYQANEFTLSYIAEVENGPIAEGRIQVTVKNAPPILLVKELTTLSGLPWKIDLAGQISDPDDDSFTVEVMETARPSGTLRIENNVLNYTPTSDYFGADEFKIKAADKFGASAVYPIKVSVTPSEISLNVLDSQANISHNYGFHITAETHSHQYMGNALSGFGDLNGDGMDELFISSYSSFMGPPKLFVLLGAKDKTRNLVSNDLFQPSGEFNSRVILLDQMAFPLSDIDLDGIDDVITNSGTILYGSSLFPKFLSPQTVKSYSGRKTLLQFDGVNADRIAPFVGDFISGLGFPHYQNESDNFSMFVNGFADREPHIAISHAKGAQINKYIVPITTNSGLDTIEINSTNSLIFSPNEWDDFTRSRSAYRTATTSKTPLFLVKKNDGIYLMNHPISDLLEIVPELKNVVEIADINGDGFGEFVFAAKNKLYIKFGEAMNMSNISSFLNELKQFLAGNTDIGSKKVGLIIEQNGIERQWLSRVEGIGDLNSDGVGDLAIRGHGHPDYPSNLSLPKDYYIRMSNSSLYILWGNKLLGGTINLDTIEFAKQRQITKLKGFYRDNEVIATNGIGDGTGLTFSGASDFNGDGFTDLAVGSPEFSTHRSISDASGTQVGRVSVLYGGPHWRGQ